MSTADVRTGDTSQLGAVVRHVSTAVPLASPGTTTDEVFATMAGRVFDSAAVVAVVDGSRLVGLVTIERLLAAAPGTPVREVMDAAPPVVAPHTDQEHATWVAVQHAEPTLAVVDDEGGFLGLVPPTALVRVLLEEHDEDLVRLGGFLRSSSSAQTTTVEPVVRRLGHRLPWLLIGLLGSLLAAGVVGSFEAELAQVVLIAYFVPGVVYMADAVGTQTEALVIRGLSVGVSVGQIAVREAITGVVLGVLLAGLAVVPIGLIWGSWTVAVAVALALVVASSIATLIALGLPWLFHRFGADPAFGSGPLATVVQDVLTVAIYLAVASAVVL